jgi:hypothetical protein
MIFHLVILKYLSNILLIMMKLDLILNLFLRKSPHLKMLLLLNLLNPVLVI